jgi:hypothetical protein
MTDDPKIGIQWLRVSINPDGTLAIVDCTPSTFPVELGVAGLKCADSSLLSDGGGPRSTRSRPRQGRRSRQGPR